MKIIKEGIEEKGRDYVGPSFGYDHESQYFAICDEAGEPVDVFEGSESDCEAFMKAEYGNAYSCEELTEDEYYDTIDLIGFDSGEVPIKEAIEEDPKVVKFKEFYRKLRNLPEDFELTKDNVDDWAFTHTCSTLGWNKDSAKATILGEEWEPLE